MSKEIPFENSFASHEKAKYWSEKNELKSNQVFKRSHKKYWFDCVCGHNFDSALSNINNGHWCPYCSNQKLCNNKCEKCFYNSFASHNKAKYWSNKNELKPNQVFKSSNKKYLFDCVCGHNFVKRLNSIVKGSWCSYCSNPPQELCIDEKCDKCFKNSFASHNKSKYWSNKNKLKSNSVFKNSAKKYWFDCDCDHKFETQLDSVSKGSWCPYCCNNSQKLCDILDCEICFNKSFASHNKSQFWSDKNEIKPRYVFKNANSKYWFDCICGHNYEIMLNNLNDNNSCPYCVKPSKLLCNNINECKKCYYKTFANHPKATFWSNENKLKPNQVFKSSHKKYEFICEKNHKFYSAIYHISNGKWCPKCINKTEQKLYDQLIKLYSTLEQQFKVEWCKNKTYLPFDFIIPEYKIIIELDGLQHFKQVCNWSSPEVQEQNDKYKMKCANNNGFSIIRILQEDVFYDTYDWLKELGDNIIKIKNDKIIQNIFMCKNNEYNNFL